VPHSVKSSELLNFVKLNKSKSDKGSFNFKKQRKSMLKTSSKSLLITFTMLWSVLAYSSPAGIPLKFIDFLLKDSGVVEALARHGILGEPATRVQTYVRNSLTALSTRSGDMSPVELRRTLSGLSLQGDDLRLRNQLLELLERNADEMAQEDMVTAINNLIYLANRHGVRGSVVLACSECVSDALRRHGFRFTLASVQNESAQQVLENVVPRNPRDLSNFINRRMTAMNLGNYRNAPRELIGPEEERALGLFLGLAEHGTEVQKEFVAAVVDFSRVGSNDVRLLNPDNPHIFWRFFDQNPSDEKLRFHARMLREAAQESNVAGREDAYYRSLSRHYQNNDEALRMIDELRLKKCLFR
jgi:hypothetical protein